MKKQLIILLIAIAPFAGKAQIDFASFLEAGTADAEKLLEGYLKPAFLGFGYGINSGWYNTAKPHKLLGFDITPTVSFARVPSSDEFFTIDDSDFTNLSVIGTIDGNGNIGSRITQGPTLFGPNLPNEQLPFLQYTSDNGTPGDPSDDTQVNISSPTGLGLEEEIGFSAVPSGMVQVGIGLFKNTELKLRIIPKIESTNSQGQTDFEFEMFGLGFIHDLKQWVPGFKQLPIDVSGFVGWNKITTTIAIDPALDQRAKFSTSSFTLQGLVSKQLALLTLFAGVGIATTRTQFELLGDYEIEGSRDPLTDPVAFDFSSTGPRINLGFRLKLLILTLHADYAIQKYSTLTTGIGISIR